MLLDNARLFLGLYVRPRASLAGIVDGGSLGFGALLALGVAGLVATGPGGGLAGSLLGLAATVVALAVLYVPATLLLVTMFDRVGSFGVALRRDYAPLLCCTLMAWSAALLPAGIALRVLGPRMPWMAAVAGAAALLFATLMVLALRVVTGARAGAAIGAVALSWLAFLLKGFLTLLLSPCLFWAAYHGVRGDLGSALGSWGSRQSFKRHLQAATVNPNDAEAHYQLGLIHLQRQQPEEAAQRFRQAIAIDARETDAHFQLAKLARRAGRLPEALQHLDVVLRQDPKHAQHEAWREAGAVYLDHGSHAEARQVLTTYVEARPYDAEGLYLLGRAHAALDDSGAARGFFERCVEAARTAPDHRQRDVRPWRQKAEQELRRA